MALLPLLSGCQTNPATDVSISSESSLLAVDVLFPAPLSRDPSLVQVFLVKGPIHGGLAELPELIPASFVKWSRAYLLDPEPGTYSVVAVTSAFAPPWNDYPIAGVEHTRYSGTSADATIFPVELIDRTRTTVAPGRVAFMGALRVGQGERIDANSVLQDDLQRRIAERIRPGATSESGLAGWLKRTRMLDLGESSFSDEVADRESFFENALEDFGDSPWAQVIARVPSPDATAAMARTPAPRPMRTVPTPPTAATKPEPPPVDREVATPDPTTASRPPAATFAPPAATLAPPATTLAPEAAPSAPEAASSAPEAATSEPDAAPPELHAAIRPPETATRQPQTSPPIPKQWQFPSLPPGSPLAKIEFGMSHHEVREILGAPDDRLDRSTAKAWIPFYSGPGAYLRDWIYQGEGRVVFSRHDSSLVVLDVIYDPQQRK